MKAAQLDALDAWIADLEARCDEVALIPGSQIHELQRDAPQILAGCAKLKRLKAAATTLERLLNRTVLR